jgi:hypothetical protein
MIIKPIASLSLDLDNKWAYMKTHGDAGWETFPSYFDVVVPRILKVLEDFGNKITFFVVGQDAELEKNHKALAAISAAGHEIGNHSFHHNPWLHLYTPEELEQELDRSENAIRAATGEYTIGFRGPGFSLSDQTLRTLSRRGYLYDCSTFPTFVGPAARAYYFFHSRLTRQQKEERKELFGRMSDGFQSNKPFYWQFENDRLLEIPVTTFPIVKMPIHASYLMYLRGFSPAAARCYFGSALRMCRWTGVQPSILLHPLDFLGNDDDRDLAFFPAMKQTAHQKLQLMDCVLEMMNRQFNIVPMREHAAIAAAASLSDRSIQFARSGAT